MLPDCLQLLVQITNKLQKEFTGKKQFINKKNKVFYKLWIYRISDYFTFQNQYHLDR